MQTVHLCNHHLDWQTPWLKWGAVGLFAILCCLTLWWAPSLYHLVVILCLLVLLFGLSWWILRLSRVQFTLTATHLSQQVAKGGWVVKWSNIQQIGICEYQNAEGWCQPLPWIGIRLKQYEPYLDSICPRLASDILMSQRALLYLGAKQHPMGAQFEDIILDALPYEGKHGKRYSGLAAMLANRMHYQREFHGYDIFISTADLDREAEDFVGLARRYLAAAEPDTTQA
ncbi:DUF2982 domain-containing protein [Vibrio porteresiae]|uniref:DUF2982 domain-containing protein n=1 Tax=Vibrio porteresiae DSM 19223 TaxID=1123496 RepID=A0ABZ0Q842_9VIBR|nr:DUF2982 domain-containing protein [Vibrio porteresiae]WPC72347.1 DUF2982 domain-containing protein [Vibrio porteresiae DSM 19223]